MPISGTYDFTVTANQIIAGALRTLGVIGEGDAPTNEQYNTGAEALNMMCKAWIAEGLPIWLVKEIWVELQQGKDTYTIGGVASSGKATTTAAGNFPQKVYQAWFRNRDAVTTAWTADTVKATNDTVYPTTENGFYYIVSSVAGDAKTHATTEPTWPTVAGATVVDDQVTWTAVAWNKLDIPATILSEQEYNMLGNKSTAGQPIQCFYKKLLNYGELKTFPVSDANNAGKRFYILAQTPYSDFNGSAGTYSSTPDFPVEFSRALKFGLANELVFEYGVDRFTRSDIERRAEAYKQQVYGFEQEEESINFKIDIRNW